MLLATVSPLSQLLNHRSSSGLHRNSVKPGLSQLTGDLHKFSGQILVNEENDRLDFLCWAIFRISCLQRDTNLFALNFCRRTAPISQCPSNKGGDGTLHSPTGVPKKLQATETVAVRALLSMEEILHQLRLVVYPIICKGFIHPRWCRTSSTNSMNQIRWSWELRPSKNGFIKPCQGRWSVKGFPTTI